MGDAGLGKTFGVAGGDVQPGCLLQARLGEQHLPGELTELGLGAGPQA
ncbi:hypothetical protein PJL18_02424 [Paenarthrobacter nicotinovorans]|nr:hypothetical protein [Paenarthrobacter nicotinovorans]